MQETAFDILSERVAGRPFLLERLLDTCERPMDITGELVARYVLVGALFLEPCLQFQAVPFRVVGSLFDREGPPLGRIQGLREGIDETLHRLKRRSGLIVPLMGLVCPALERADQFSEARCIGCLAFPAPDDPFFDFF
jgi:hypothetical protein